MNGPIQPVETAEGYLPIWYQEVLDVLVMHAGSTDYGLHVEFLNVLMLPKPADM